MMSSLRQRCGATKSDGGVPSAPVALQHLWRYSSFANVGSGSAGEPAAGLSSWNLFETAAIDGLDDESWSATLVALQTKVWA